MHCSFTTVLYCIDDRYAWNIILGLNGYTKSYLELLKIQPLFWQKFIFLSLGFFSRYSFVKNLKIGVQICKLLLKYKHFDIRITEIGLEFEARQSG